MKRVIVFFVLLLLSVACATPLANVDAPRNNGEPENIARVYATWTKMFDAPQNVSGFLMALCRLPKVSEQAYLDSAHAEFFVQVYVNPIGAETMKTEGARVFPEGAIIVKEKWARDARFQLDASAKTRAGLGIMVKEKNDWRFEYVDAAGKITRDQKQLEHCRACHAGNQARDAVFYPEVFAQ